LTEKFPLLVVKDINKFFLGLAGSKIHVLENVNFQVEHQSSGEIISILAPFGAGKTTLLRIINGLEKSSSGQILLNGNTYNEPSGEIGFIPENPSSFPWYTVKQNLEFALSLKKKKIKDDNYSLKNIIDLLELTGYEDHFPLDKHSGFRFRIALGRALILKPAIVLIDDPFKKFDSETQHELYALIKKISFNLKTSFLLTTTNITEAIILSDSILIMRRDPGKIIQRIDIEKNADKENMETFTYYQNEIKSAFASLGDSPLISIIN